MSNARKVAVVGGPLVVLVAAAIFVVLLWKQDQAAVASWIAIGGLVVATVALVITWLTWVRPMPPVESRPSVPGSRPTDVKIDGDKSFGTANNSRVVYGNRNRIGEGKRR